MPEWVRTVLLITVCGANLWGIYKNHKTKQQLDCLIWAITHASKIEIKKAEEVRM